MYKKILHTLSNYLPSTGPMKISIMMPNYNHSHYLKDNINGLLAQSYQNWELNIVDDGSTDDSVVIIKSYADKDKRIKPIYFSQNQGVMPAAHAAFDVADGDLLYCSAADDYISNKHFFKHAIYALTENPSAAGFFGKSSVIDIDTGAKKWLMGNAPQEGFLAPEDALKAFLHSQLFIPGVSSIWRRNLVNRCGGYDAALGAQCDYFINHALPALEGVIFSQEIMAVSRFNPKSVSSSVKNDDFFRQHALVEKKIKALDLSFQYQPEWFQTWREHVINGRLAVTRQTGFIQNIRDQIASIEPWEKTALPTSFQHMAEQLLKDFGPIEKELEIQLAKAQEIFDKEAGVLALPQQESRNAQRKSA